MVIVFLAKSKNGFRTVLTKRQKTCFSKWLGAKNYCFLAPEATPQRLYPKTYGFWTNFTKYGNFYLVGISKFDICKPKSLQRLTPSCLPKRHFSHLF
jgi:hypothetical protein